MVVEDGLEEGWNEGDWKPTLPFIVLSTRPGVEGKEMVMQLRGSYEDRASGACKEVWCGVVWCGVVLCGLVWCGVVWCGVV